MGFSLKGAISGAVSGFAATGSPWGAAAGAGLGGMFGGDEASDAKAIYDRQYQDSINLWNMQNAYNTPLQQRKRLVEAGYNPNLWYTQGNTGNAGTISQPSYPSYAQSGNSALSNLFSKLSLRSAKADVAGKEADTEYKQLQLDYLRARIDALRRGKAGVSATKILTPYEQNKQQKAIEEMSRRMYEEEHPILGSFENLKTVPYIGGLIRPFYRFGETLGAGFATVAEGYRRYAR